MAASPSFLVTSTLLLLAPCLAFAYNWPDNVTQIKGYVEVNKTHGVHLYYWFFESRSKPSTDPLVVWLTGGPGCSSMLALLTENGPFLIPDGTSEPVFNKYGWNEFSNVMFVDQPAGTGFSYVSNPLGYVTNERQVGTELWTLLQEFYKQHSKYSGLDLFIVGESYAGHYVPATAQVIVESNSVFAKNLKGIGIGNGWVDPLLQYPAYAKYALQEGLINQSVADAAAVLYAPCKILIETHIYPVAFVECQLIETTILAAAELKAGHSINVYDIRKECKVPPLCYDMSNVTKFLNRKDVQQDLGVSRRWEACVKSVELLLLSDWVHEFADAVGKVLDAGRRVLAYSGKEDFICNYLGGASWTNSTKWSKQASFLNATTKDWKVGTTVVGQVKTGGGLTFAAVDAAGHMVPLDQPAVALALLDHLVHNKPYTT